jgi:ribonuclease BN (tRNA processing enzyme)
MHKLPLISLFYIQYTFLSCHRVHLSHIDIVRSSAYQAWVSKFGSKTQHIFIGEGCHNGKSSYLAASIYNYELNSLLGNVFPSITSIEHFQSPIPNTNNLPQELPGLRLMKYNLLPIKRAGIELPSDPLLLLEEARKFVKERGTSFKSTLEQLYSKREELLLKESSKTAYSVVCLGTGCAVPSKYRNVSSICIYNYTAHSGILLDAGEGSWNQMMNIEPPVHDILLISYLERVGDCSVAPGAPKDCPPGYNVCALQWARIVNVVWISHPHADHHLGLITIINERKKAYDYIQRYIDANLVFEPLLIIAPIILQQFLYEVVDIYPELSSLFLFIPNNIFDPLEQCNTTLPGVVSSSQPQSHIVDARKKVHADQRNHSTQTDGQVATVWFSGKSVGSDAVNLMGSVDQDLNHKTPSYDQKTHSSHQAKSDSLKPDSGDSNIDIKPYSSNGSVKVTVGGKRRQFDDRDANGAGSGKGNKIIDGSSNQMSAPQRTPKRTRLNPPSVTEIYQRLDFDHIIRAKERFFEAFGIVSLVNIPVIHCRQSYGIILTLRIAANFQTKLLFDRANSMDESDEIDDEKMEGTTPISPPELVYEEVKIVYSGDTRPSDNLIAFGRNATLLIHEATFEDDKLAEAMGKRHSTILEACEVARGMNAKHLLLTHFSQRYNGVPRQFHPNGGNPIDLIDQKKQDALNQLLAMQEEQFSSTPLQSNHNSSALADEERVILPIIASDFMTFHNEDLVWLPYLTHVLAELFPAEEDDDEDEMKG